MNEIVQAQIWRAEKIFPVREKEMQQKDVKSVFQSNFYDGSYFEE